MSGAGLRGALHSARTAGSRIRASSTDRLRHATHSRLHDRLRAFVPPVGRPNPDPARNITAALTLDPDFIFIPFTGNDIKKGHTVGEALANMETIVAEAAVQGVPVWVGTPKPRSNLTAQGLLGLNLMHALVVQDDPNAADLWTTFANPDGTLALTYDSGDGVHINDSGHDLLFQRVVDVTILPGPTGPLGYWSFDEGLGCTAADTSPNGNDGTIGPCCPGIAPAWSPDGQVGGALAFHGGSESVLISAPALDDLDAVSVAAWVKHDPITNHKAIFDKRDANADGFSLFILVNSLLKFRVNASSVTGTTIVDDGQWHHVAGTYDGTQLVVCLDGVEEARAVVGAHSLQTTAPLLLGKHFVHGSMTLEGDLDEPHVHAQGSAPRKSQRSRTRRTDDRS